MNQFGKGDSPIHSRNKKQQPALYTGIISRIYGAYYSLLPADSLEPELPAKPRGRLRLEKREIGGLRHRHLLMIGDRVSYTLPRPGEPAQVQALLERRNALYRAVNMRLQSFGANLDRAVVMMSLTEPEPNFRFLDRLLVSCHSAGVDPLLVFSKKDRLGAGDPVFEMTALYRGLGYPVFELNLTDPDLEADPGFQAFRERLLRGSSVVVGRSGTGKSTLLNRLLGGDYQKTDSISSIGKGRHTTTNSTLFLYNNKQAFLIDTPGVKEWGIDHVDRLQILAGFRELETALGACEFSNCIHQADARGCAVQAALEASRLAAEESAEGIAEDEIRARERTRSALREPDGPLHPDRYYSLLAMLDSPR